ncbi:MAG: polysaccharide deacetylase family protein [Paludibacteraceae bacterium]|nr:polysaccharide deacetylase family protein [Paludibacteraceae bacterium]MBR6104182.1 polysaccharide deacetylase family protein [Paludibacteraceae bacterium]
MFLLVTSAIIVFLSLLIYLFYASYYIGSGVYLKAQCKVPVKEKTVFLSFDDGPSAYTTRVLDVLKRHNAKAIFFLIGENAEKNPELVKAIVAEGHVIGNHSFCHKGTFPLMSSKQIAEDIKHCNQTLTDITGKTPNLFRPPFGVTNPLIASGLKKTGIPFKTIGWDVRSFDTMGGDTDKILNRITDQIEPGSIVLLHDRMEFSAELLDKLLTHLKTEGWRIGIPKFQSTTNN